MKKLLLLLLFIPLISFSQSVRSIEIETYKYIVIDEIIGKHSGEIRRFFTKNLKKGGYNVVNLKKPLKTHESFPEDLKNNPDLALYLVAEEDIRGCYYITSNLLDYEGNVKLSREGKSCGLLSSSIKKSISGLTSYNYKYNPELKRKSQIKRGFAKGQWAGNGSGVIISKLGHIITNHHVIKDADDIEVEFILNNEVKKFNAEIVQVDKINDLAILKIIDINFDGVDELPYNFKTRSSDVGTKVYAFGYPMALSIMGKEIKVTDGMISSKTGFDGDITTYQITAPIQAGNSGGPLFDEKGNLIGINSSGIRKDIADNVAYSIKTSYLLNLIDILPKSLELPSNKKLESLELTEQIKEISKYVVLIKVK
ncbi:serine protease [Lutibacter sp. TH_r2]|uniref:S1C family serine protease n=1 Tax=Lutibacter sp. TH_r2 TaxID=3082083 RepID=UPI002955BA6A|nr:serine protease [Lutibacter sp. TH_r2]MDV7187962.1 serine protease [Lutibacter sp. TH_r2]